MSRIQRAVKLNSTLAGKPVRLREGIYKQLREREWIFNRVDKNSIFLIHKNGAYGVVVGIEDIDWDEILPRPSTSYRKCVSTIIGNGLEKRNP